MLDTFAASTGGQLDFYIHVLEIFATSSVLFYICTVAELTSASVWVPLIHRAAGADFARRFLNCIRVYVTPSCCVVKRR